MSGTIPAERAGRAHQLPMTSSVAGSIDVEACLLAPRVRAARRAAPGHLHHLHRTPAADADCMCARRQPDPRIAPALCLLALGATGGRGHNGARPGRPGWRRWSALQTMAHMHPVPSARWHPHTTSPICHPHRSSCRPAGVGLGGSRRGPVVARRPPRRAARASTPPTAPSLPRLLWLDRQRLASWWPRAECAALTNHRASGRGGRLGRMVASTTAARGTVVGDGGAHSMR